MTGPRGPQFGRAVHDHGAPLTIWLRDQQPGSVVRDRAARPTIRLRGPRPGRAARDHGARPTTWLRGPQPGSVVRDRAARPTIWLRGPQPGRADGHHGVRPTIWLCGPPPGSVPGGPPLWVVVHVMVKCIEGLYELWRVRDIYTLIQVERHRALTTKFSKAWGDRGWSPTRWIHWCLAHSTSFAEKWRNIFQFSSIPTEYRHGPYKRRLRNGFKGWSLVRQGMSLRHMHHCMSMNAPEQGLLGLEAAKGSDIDDFV